MLTLDPQTADEVYRVALAGDRRPPLRRALVVALDVWFALSGGTLECSSAGTVEVHERHSGRRVLAIDVESPKVASHTLHHLRTELAELSPEEFREQWGVDERAV